MSLPVDALSLALLLLALVLAAASAWATAARTALFGLQSGDRRQLSEGGRTDQQVLRQWEQRVSVTSTLRTLTLSAYVVATSLVATVLYQADPALVPWTPLFLLPPMLLITEVAPRVLAFRYGLLLARLSAWPLALVHGLAAPIRVPVEAVLRGVTRLLGADPSRQDETRTEETLRLLLHHGTASGALDPLERDIIEAVFDFDDLTVDRLMTPRPDIFSIPLDIDGDELLARCRDEGHSRIPVYSDRADNIVGVLLQKDLLKHRRAPLQGPRQLRSLLLPPVFVPPSRSADAMLREFLGKHFHMAFVVDEHGALLGLVTLDDLLRELVGDLDGDTDSAEIDRISPDSLTVKAGIDLQEFVEETGIDLPEGDYRTLGGFILHQLGRLPETGDRIPHGEVTLTVTAMDGRRVAEVEVQLPAGTPREVAG